MAHYSINIKLPIAVYILISILLVAVGWGNLYQLAPWEELFNILIEQTRLQIMCDNTPAAGGETKPVVKHEGRPSYHGGCNNENKITTTIIIPKGKSLERTRTFAEKIFEAKRNRSEQVANLKTCQRPN